jgi:hypothetical protein
LAGASVHFDRHRPDYEQDYHDYENDGWYYYMKGCTVSGECTYTPAVFKTRCTERSQVITLNLEGVIEKRFLKNEGWRDAIDDYEVLEIFDQEDPYTCAIERFDLKVGNEYIWYWYYWYDYGDYDNLYWFYDLLEVHRTNDNSWSQWHYHHEVFMDQIYPDYDEYSRFDLYNHNLYDPMGGFRIDTDVSKTSDVAYYDYILYLEAYARGGKVMYKQLNMTIDVCMYENLTLTNGDDYVLEYTLDAVYWAVTVEHIIQPEWSSNDSYCFPV